MSVGNSISGSGSISGNGNMVPINVPDTPSGVSATEGGIGQAVISFTAPFNGNSAIIDYTVIVYNSSGNIVSSATGNSSPITIGGLTKNATYSFTVSARNSKGSGTPSSHSNNVVVYGVPDAPTIGSVTAGNASASVAFTAPSNNGGLYITSYTVKSSPGNITATGTTSPINVTGLTNGTSYTFQVKAHNAEGDSNYSSSSSSVTPTSPAAGVSTDTFFVAPNDSYHAPNAMYSTTNGTTWSTITMPSNNAWKVVNYGNTVLVAAGGNSPYPLVYSSDGGSSWTSATNPFGSSAVFDIAYGNGKFVAVSGNNFSTSTNGATWSAQASLASYSQGIILHKTGGTTHAPTGVFIAFNAGSRTTLTSTNGTTWTTRTNALPSESGTTSWGVIDNNRDSSSPMTVMLWNGNYGATAKGAYTTNGTTWTEINLPTSGAWFSVAYGGGYWVGIGKINRATVYSSDGTSWTQGGTLPNQSGYLSGGGFYNVVGYVGGKFVALAGPYLMNDAYSSNNGVTWTLGTSPNIYARYSDSSYSRYHGSAVLALA